MPQYSKREKDLIIEADKTLKKLGKLTKELKEKHQIIFQVKPYESLYGIYPYRIINIPVDKHAYQLKDRCLNRCEI